MKYSLEFTRKALADISEIKRSTPKSYSKLEKLLDELTEHPNSGTGRPEALKYELAGYWSRRIDKKNRLIWPSLKNVQKQPGGVAPQAASEHFCLTT